MHNNFYFLSKLSERLRGRLTGFTLVSCFSQERDELVMELNNGKESFFIKVVIGGDFQCLYFPEHFKRARKNSVDLFLPVIMKTVEDIFTFRNERSLGIKLTDGLQLVFKMHGRPSNVILFEHEKVVEVFRKNLSLDLTLQLSGLHRDIDWSYERFGEAPDHPERLYFTFGKYIWDYLSTQGFTSKSLKDRFEAIQEIRKQLEHPVFSIIKEGASIRLSLLKENGVVALFQDPLEAINEFFVLRNKTAGVYQLRARLHAHLEGRRKQTESFLEKNRSKLNELTGDQHYQQWADLIMAHLHEINQGMVQFETFPFDAPAERIIIPLRRDLTPQKNAELYYRKGKNKQIEIDQLRAALHRKEKDLGEILEQLAQLETANVDQLETMQASLSGKASAGQERIALPYHSFRFKDFDIWVGKHAEANDTLTTKLAHKEDMWLHAKDVAGSHVIIKNQGKNFPKDVIEYAASLAAYYSKRRSESLCPVAFTLRKYVRKRKGDPAGAVVVDREEVILVEPLNSNKK
ncbi:MAG: DUF814 domain-containing protein [Bacteroidetes bacterium]|nr:DUF814 domain-containing protein [Bacteroidota bacterium]